MRYECRKKDLTGKKSKQRKVRSNMLFRYSTHSGYNPAFCSRFNENNKGE